MTSKIDPSHFDAVAANIANNNAIMARMMKIQDARPRPSAWSRFKMWVLRVWPLQWKRDEWDDWA